MVAAHFGDGAAQYDEQMVAFGVGVDQGSQGRALQYGVVSAPGSTAVEPGVELTLDGRAGQQRKLRVVDAQMHVHFRIDGAQLVDGPCHVVQRSDVGHTDQAHADAFAADGVDGVVLGQLVQFPGMLQYQMGKGLVPLRLVVVDAAPFIRHCRDLCQAARLGLGQPCDALLHITGMGLPEAGAVRAVLRGLLKFVDPQAAGIDWLARTFAAVLLMHRAPGTVGQEQTLHQCRWQRGRGQQYP